MLVRDAYASSGCAKCEHPQSRNGSAVPLLRCFLYVLGNAMFMPNDESSYSLWLNDVHCCHRPANVIASGPGGVIRKNGRKISKDQTGLPR